MVEAVVSFTLQEIHKLVLEEGRLSCCVSSRVMVLEKHLEEIKSLLHDAEQRRHKEKTVAHWITEIRDVAYRAEAAVEKHVAAQVSSSRRRRGGLRKAVSRYSCILKECYTLRQLGSEISQINSELEGLIKKLQAYGIRSFISRDGDGGSRSTTNDNQNFPRMTHPDFEIGDCFVGMEDELKQLHSLLTEDKQHRVISVWGMGGSGKTTIARKVYNLIKQSKSGDFDSFAWVCITQQCRVRSVLEDILDQLLPPKRMNVSRSLSLSDGQQIPQKREDVASLRDRELMEQLHEVQTEKRCLIVVDDLWKTSHWDAIKHPFLVQNIQSKILVTTRNQDVAEVGFPLKHGLLNIDDAWELLKKKAFPHANIPDFAFEEKLGKIGKEMVQKCGYLPLAISLLGGVLRKKSSIMEWELVNENISAYMYRDGRYDEKENEIEGVLNLSFEDLPNHLRSCFLYLGMLPEDESIPVNDLFSLWIAQGMISNANIRVGREERITNIAQGYLSELASRCIVQVESENEEDMTCKLHDVVRELCLLIGKREDFGVKVLEYQGGNLRTLLQNALSRIKTRYLAIYFEEELKLEGDEDIITITSQDQEDSGKYLRSLHVLNVTNPWRPIEFPARNVVDLKKFKLLKSLVIKGFKFAEGKLPRGITDLIHLRLLRLEECELDKLPSSISKLVFLDTLELYFAMNVRIPDAVKKMFRLKHLILPFYEEESVGNYRLRLDQGLEELESLMGLDSSVHDLKFITRMKNLRCFSATARDSESLSAVISDTIATDLNKLEFCSIVIERGCEFTSEEGLKKLKHLFSCAYLSNLVVHVELGKQLAECKSDIIRSKLVSLALIGCELEDDPMGILGELPYLRELYLHTRSFVGEEITCPAFSFPRLKTLEIYELPKWREWRVEAGAMPLLSKLEIIACLRLEMLPDGLRGISNLQRVVVLRMPEFAKRLSPSGKDFHKVSHVPSIITDLN